MGDKKCTFGKKLPVDITMLNEVIYREVKHFRNYTIYTPNFRSVPVAGKFYAAHDQIKETEDQTQRIDSFAQGVTQSRGEGPHTKYREPATENQVYGWYETYVTLDRSDPRFYNPKRESEHTKTEVKILMSLPKKTKK